ncbi:MAG TPA: alpha/beta hydrolase, partial [Terrimicrobiaceae bacterium]
YNGVARLGEIACPTLVVVGDQDILGGRAFSEELAHGIPGARLIILEQAAHGLVTESAEATATVMAGFLAELDRHWS